MELIALGPNFGVEVRGIGLIDVASSDSVYRAIRAAFETAVSPQDFCGSCSSIQNFGSYLGGACSPVLTGLIVDRTGSFGLALAIGGVVMAVGAAVYYFLVGAPITDANLSDRPPLPIVVSR